MTPNVWHRIRAAWRHCPDCLHFEWMHHKHPRFCIGSDMCQGCNETKGK